MSAPDLDREMIAAALRVRKPHVEKLVALGIPMEAMEALIPEQFVFGLARVRPVGDGFYEPDDAGDWSMIMPVMDRVDPVGPGLLTDDTLDLIAFTTDQPERWRWRLGNAWALSAELLNDGLPVDVVAQPLDWLARGGRAVCILDWSNTSPCWPAMRSGPPLNFTDDRLRQRVRNALVKSAAMPIMEYFSDAA